MFKVFYAKSPTAMLDPVEYASTGIFSRKFEEVLPLQTKSMGVMTMPKLFERFNDDLPRIWGIRSMSVGDVFESLSGDRYVVDHAGFTKIAPPVIKRDGDYFDRYGEYLLEAI